MYCIAEREFRVMHKHPQREDDLPGSEGADWSTATEADPEFPEQ